jgi:flagellar basal-body rod protein FlgB
MLDTTQLALQAAMQGSMERQTLLTNNLANVNTPGYQREDLNFQSQLQNAIQSGQSPDQTSFQVTTQPAVASADGNGVNSEQEQAYIAENGLLYQDLAGVASQREQILKYAIGA